jgi:hypothetical protein
VPSVPGGSVKLGRGNCPGILTRPIYIALGTPGPTSLKREGT